MPQEYKLILKHADEPGYTPDIECYLKHGGYEVLKKALTLPPLNLPDGKKKSPQEQLRDEVMKSGVRGRGGAGFSCGLKWSFVDRKSGKPFTFDAMPPACNGGACIVQPGTRQRLDSLGDRLMQKVQYRRVGGVESLWVTHTFRSSLSGPTGSQWAQIDVTGGSIAAAPLQQQLYNPGDGIYRWMSSIAADNNGNVALGYSTSNATSPNFPSIKYAGRLVGDPADTMPQGEAQLVAGNGSQTNNCGPGACSRWGDYSATMVDPVDDTTMWTLQEYSKPEGPLTGCDSGVWSTWWARVSIQRIFLPLITK